MQEQIQSHNGSEPAKSMTKLQQFLQRHVTAIDIGAGVLIIIFVMTTVLYALRYDQLKNELQRMSQTISHAQTNKEVTAFTKLFIDRVLKAKGEIDFETRLSLEGAVRGLKDAEILDAWKTFTDSKTESQAQNAVKNLLGLLVGKIQ